jgi:deoxyribodipyrimidine photo-lyase
MGSGLVWIRRDIRLHDHVALSHALREHDQVYVAFIFDDAILAPIKRKATSDKRVQFIAESLVELHQGLKAHGGGVLIRYGNPVEAVPQLVREYKIDRLYFNRDYSPYALERDAKVTQEMTALGVNVSSFKDHVIHEPGDILNRQETPYRVFTPYSREWQLRLGGIESIPTFPVTLDRLAPVFESEELASVDALLSFAGFQPEKMPLKGGTIEGLRRLAEFSDHIGRYHISREFPGISGTSGLSVYLRHGCVSVRDMLNLGLQRSGIGADKWVSELIWREFYQMIFFHFPWVNSRPFQEKYADLKMDTSEEYLACFKAGKTGFPLIDAAMRCLNQTGWMHNRLRMVTASFLTKILLVDWKRGERYFSWKLLDYELQSNNGGWQWATGIGCDAVPYFRIFNPTTQSQKYDPEGAFIREFCPELSGLSANQIHCPSTATRLPVSFQLGRDYPFPIVDYAAQRKKALALYKMN